jgi:hypothetical protein
VKRAIALSLLLAGCSNTAWQLNAGQPPPVNSAVHVHSSGGLATVLGLTILAAGAYELARSDLSLGGFSPRTPEMAPDRKVSEQDCSKPIDITLGNLRCK